MGKCFSQDTKISVAPTQSTIDNVSDLKEQAIALIFTLNSHKISCKKNFQDSLLNKNKKAAISIKIKEKFIDSKLAILQNLVKKLEDPDKVKFSHRILKGSFIPLKAIEDLIESGDLHNPSAYTSNLNISLAEIESEISAQLASIDTSGNFIRRRYFKNNLIY